MAGKPTIKKSELVNLATHGPLTKGFSLAKHQGMTTYSVVDPEGQVHLADEEGHAFETVDQARTFAITRRWTRNEIA